MIWYDILINLCIGNLCEFPIKLIHKAPYMVTIWGGSSDAWEGSSVACGRCEPYAPFFSRRQEMLVAAECHNYMNGQCLPDVWFFFKGSLNLLKVGRVCLESILAISFKSYNNICALCLSNFTSGNLSEERIQNMEKVICAKIISIVELFIMRMGEWAWYATGENGLAGLGSHKHKLQCEYNDGVHLSFSWLQVIGTDFGRWGK